MGSQRGSSSITPSQKARVVESFGEGKSGEKVELSSLKLLFSPKKKKRKKLEPKK